MLTHRISKGWSSGSASIARSFDISAGAESNIDESIAAGEVDKQVALAMDVSQLKSLFIMADKDCTVKTNNAAVPVNTFALKAGQPFAWNFNDSALRDTAGTAVVTDVTSIFVTNPAESAVLLQLRALLDPTI